MGKTIYLPLRAKAQFEESAGTSIYDPLPYSDKPSKRFPFEVVLNDNTLELSDVLEEGKYYPDRDQDLDSTIETIERVI